MADVGTPTVYQTWGGWTPIRELGRGGQGITHLAHKSDRSSVEQLKHHLKSASAITVYSADPIENLSGWRAFAEGLAKLRELGALKILHEVKEDEEGNKARERMAREIETMSEIHHPHLLALLDRDADSRWYVTEYHPRGTLGRSKELYTGQPLKALRDIRGLVEAVSILHERKRVHRDIKPANVFIAGDSRLVLGDFGLLHLAEDDQSRVSGTYENVGSRDWMPPWALSMRLEDVRPTFDVFGLGKLLYAMVSKLPVLQLWYHRESRFLLNTMFPGVPGISWIQHILDGAVVQNESDVKYRSALELLSDIDVAIWYLERSGERGPGLKGKCEQCGLGTLVEHGPVSLGGLQIKVRECTDCSHMSIRRVAPTTNEPPLSEVDGVEEGPIHVANEGTLRIELLALKWVHEGGNRAVFRARLVVENRDDAADSLRPVTLRLDDQSTRLNFQAGSPTRLEPWGRTEVVVWGQPNYSEKEYKAVLSISTARTRVANIEFSTAPSSRRGAWD